MRCLWLAAVLTVTLTGLAGFGLWLAAIWSAGPVQRELMATGFLLMLPCVLAALTLAIIYSNG